MRSDRFGSLWAQPPARVRLRKRHQPRDPKKFRACLADTITADPPSDHLLLFLRRGGNALFQAFDVGIATLAFNDFITLRSHEG